MELTPTSVGNQRDWVIDQAGTVVPLVNRVRTDLGSQFGTEVASIDEGAYVAAVNDVFGEGDRAVNIAAIVGVLRELDVEDDYPGFVVDELLGRELAGMIAGEQPLRLLAEATFHYADVVTAGGEDEPAGIDDLTAALAAGFQTRLPGWKWRDRINPFEIT